MSGQLVGEVIDASPALQKRGLSERGFHALIAIAEKCHPQTRQGSVRWDHIRDGLYGASLSTAKRAVADLKSAGAIRVLKRGFDNQHGRICAPVYQIEPLGDADSWVAVSATTEQVTQVTQSPGVRTGHPDDPIAMGANGSNQGGERVKSGGRTGHPGDLLDGSIDGSIDGEGLRQSGTSLDEPPPSNNPPPPNPNGQPPSDPEPPPFCSQHPAAQPTTAAAAEPHAAPTTPGRNEPSNASPSYSTPSADRSTPATTATKPANSSTAPHSPPARNTPTSDNPTSPHCVPNATLTETNSPHDRRTLNGRRLDDIRAAAGHPRWWLRDHPRRSSGVVLSRLPRLGNAPAPRRPGIAAAAARDPRNALSRRDVHTRTSAGRNTRRGNTPKAGTALIRSASPTQPRS